MHILREPRRPMKLHFFFILFISLFLTACATMSKEECKLADWNLKGVDDASQGFPLDRVIEHGKACARVDIVPDMRAYRKGHGKGARLYCIPEKGYSEGRKGAVYNNICPADLEITFLQAYRDGQELYKIEQNINRFTNQISSNQSQIDNRYSNIAVLKTEIVKSQSEQERREKMRRISDLESEIFKLQLESDNAARELSLFRNDFRVVEDKHFRMGYLK